MRKGTELIAKCAIVKLGTAGVGHRMPHAPVSEM